MCSQSSGVKGPTQLTLQVVWFRAPTAAIGLAKLSHQLTEAQWSSMKLNKAQWASLSFTESHWVSLLTTPCHTDNPMSFHEQIQVSPIPLDPPPLRTLSYLQCLNNVLQIEAFLPQCPSITDQLTNECFRLVTKATSLVRLRQPSFTTSRSWIFQACEQVRILLKTEAVEGESAWACYRKSLVVEWCHNGWNLLLCKLHLFLWGIHKPTGSSYCSSMFFVHQI